MAESDHIPSIIDVHVSVVAAETDIEAADLRALAGRLQVTVSEYPGVADLVFEYRRTFSHDPLVARDGEAFFLLVPPRVWPEFGNALGTEDRALAALKAIHGKAFDIGTTVGDRGEWEPLVLVG